MCYSATASFVASGVLAGTSLAISRVPKDKNTIPLAVIPAVFAAHQFIEGVIWLNQDKIGVGALQPAAVMAVCLPFLASSRRGLELFGMAVLFACATALYLATRPAFPSVWCFFAAFLSAGLYVVFRAEATHGWEDFIGNRWRRIKI